jgi:hypothetical protein
VTDTLQRAIKAIQAGDRSSGKRLLAKVLRADPQNAEAWLWMSEVVDTAVQRRICLQRVLAIDPQNALALSGLARVGTRAASHKRPVPRAPQRPPQPSRQLTRQITVAGALTLSLLVGLALLAYMLFSVVPQAKARAERLTDPDLPTATLWCPSCSQAGETIPLQTRIGAGFARDSSGELPHGTVVAILDYQWSRLERRYYVEVAAQGQRGWVPESLLRQQ